MGFELAKAAAKLGGEVVLVTGPSKFTVDHQSIELIRVVTAQEMFEAVHKYYDECDIAITAAAVSDYRPSQVSEQKIKKESDTLQIDFVKNKDILLSMGDKKKHQYLVGFALETENELENAKKKLQKKNLDAIVLNSLNDEDAGFGKTTNKITFIDKNLEIKTFEVKNKAEVALDILNEIINRGHA
jgi:phosphopantothenoylcysteine decarboxylase/phosphopantothenate--cysteine ligase